MSAAGDEALGFLYAALNSERGVAVKVSDPVRYKNILYAARRTDPALTQITIAASRTNPNGELWLVKKGTDDASP